VANKQKAGHTSNGGICIFWNCEGVYNHWADNKRDQYIRTVIISALIPYCLCQVILNIVVFHVVNTTSLFIHESKWQNNFLNCSDCQEIQRILWNPEAHYRIHKTLPMGPILILSNPVHTLAPYFFNIYINIILPSTSNIPKWSFYSRVSKKNVVYISLTNNTILIKIAFFA
jgi:hypothetical protein